MQENLRNYKLFSVCFELIFMNEFFQIVGRMLDFAHFKIAAEAAITFVFSMNFNFKTIVRDKCVVPIRSTRVMKLGQVFQSNKFLYQLS